MTEQTKSAPVIMADAKREELEIRELLSHYPEHMPMMYEGVDVPATVHDTLDGFNCHRVVEGHDLYLFRAWHRAYTRMYQRVGEALSLAGNDQHEYEAANRRRMEYNADAVVWSIIHPELPTSTAVENHEVEIAARKADMYADHIASARRHLDDLQKPYYGMTEFIHGLPKVEGPKEDHEAH